MYVVEGITKAILVTASARKFSKRQMTFKSPEAALAWCRANRVGLVYFPEAQNPFLN